MLELGIFRYSAPVDAAPDPSWMDRHSAAVGRLANPDRHPVPASARSAGASAQLALLVRGWGCPADETLADCSWPRRERAAALRAASMLQRAIEAAGGRVSARRELIHVASDAFPALLAAAAALDEGGEAAEPRWRRWWIQWQRNGERIVDPPPLLSANEVAELAGVPQGPELGRLLRQLRLAQVRGEVRSAAGARRWVETHPHRPTQSDAESRT